MAERLETRYFDFLTITEPEIVTMEDGDSLEITFPSTWWYGRQFNWMIGRFSTYDRVGDWQVRVRL